jgi:hypothetical protein
MIEGWSEPKFTNTNLTFASHKASKNAKEVVYYILSANEEPIDAKTHHLAA